MKNKFNILKKGNSFVAYDINDKTKRYGSISIKTGKFIGATLCMMVLKQHLTEYENKIPNKLVHDKKNGKVILTDKSAIAFETKGFTSTQPSFEFEEGKEYNDLYCTDKVIDKVIDMYNHGKTLRQIDSYLLYEGECTEDAREVIVEGLFLIYNPDYQGE